MSGLLQKVHQFLGGFHFVVDLLLHLVQLYAFILHVFLVKTIPTTSYHMILVVHSDCLGSDTDLFAT